MVLVKVAEAKDIVLDWLVGMAEGYELNLYGIGSIRAQVPGLGVHSPWRPTYYWNQGGEIVDKEAITLSYDKDDQTYGAYVALFRQRGQSLKTRWQTGPTALVAAMRAYVASKLGAEVEVPDSLVGRRYGS